MTNTKYTPAQQLCFCGEVVVLGVDCKCVRDYKATSTEQYEDVDILSDYDVDVLDEEYKYALVGFSDDSIAGSRY